MDHFNQQNRFNRPPEPMRRPEPPEPTRGPAPKSGGSGIAKMLLKVVIFLVILGIIVWGANFLWRSMNGRPIPYDSTASDYYAVFLANGQVYFGQPVSKSKGEFVLKDVYYLQITDNTTTAQDQLTSPRFSLVKLGQEIHGPTDKLYVNMDNVLFYEQLKNDSQVVESIKSSNN